MKYPLRDLTLLPPIVNIFEPVDFADVRYLRLHEKSSKVIRYFNMSEAPSRILRLEIFNSDLFPTVQKILYDGDKMQCTRMSREERRKEQAHLSNQISFERDFKPT